MPINPVNISIKLSRLIRKYADEIEFFHATPNAGHLMGAKGNPILGKGANQGRGIYGFSGPKAQEAAEKHLVSLIKHAPNPQDTFRHYGASTSGGYRNIPGVFKFTSPKNKTRFDVLETPNVAELASSKLKKNQDAINELLKKFPITQRSDSIKDASGNIIPKQRFSYLKVGRDQSKIAPLRSPEEFVDVGIQRFKKDKMVGTRRVSDRMKGPGDLKEPLGSDDEAVMGPIFDLLRNVNKKDYNEILEELLKLNKPVALRTLTSPRMQRVL